MPRNLLLRIGDFHLHIDSIFLILMSCIVLILSGGSQYTRLLHKTQVLGVGGPCHKTGHVSRALSRVLSRVTSDVTYLVMIKTMRPPSVGRQSLSLKMLK